MSISSSRFYFEDTIFNGEDGNIKSTTSKIKDEYIFLVSYLLVKTVSNSSSSWLIDDAEYIEAGADTGILGGLMLRVVEVARYSHHSILYVMTQVGLSSLLRGEVGPVTGVEVRYNEGELVELEHVGVELRSLAGN